MSEVTTSRDFPVVCVGGSAGSLQAFATLLQHLPTDLGIAVVIVNHVRTTATALDNILPRHTSMPVELISERLVIEPNRVYIIPENRDLQVLDGKFRLSPLSKPWGWPDVITIFLRSLASFWGGKLIAIIVSGYDSDGAAALCEIKAVGGITIAQTDETAQVPSMPQEAVASGCIDLVLAPWQMGAEIARIIHSEKP
jgi:two-component system, chemotaxis family, protein-glutamate methylesterase/glutaminase